MLSLFLSILFFHAIKSSLYLSKKKLGDFSSNTHTWQKKSTVLGIYRWLVCKSILGSFGNRLAYWLHQNEVHSLFCQHAPYLHHELFLNPSCNTFLFLCGPVMITLLDVATLNLFHLIRDEVSANLLTNGLPNYEFPTISISHTFNQFNQLPLHQ